MPNKIVAKNVLWNNIISLEVAFATSSHFTYSLIPYLIIFFILSSAIVKRCFFPGWLPPYGQLITRFLRLRFSFIAGTTLIVLASCRASLLSRWGEVSSFTLEKWQGLCLWNGKSFAWRESRGCTGHERSWVLRGTKKRRHVGTQHALACSKVYVQEHLEGLPCRLYSGLEMD